MHLSSAPLRKTLSRSLAARMLEASGMVLVVFLATLVVNAPAQAQTYTTIFSFTLTDSFWPQGGLLEDANGNLYGTTVGGGLFGVGTVYELSPPAKAGGAWTKTTLWNFFSYGNTGSVPSSELAMDSFGALYGVTYLGGGTLCQCGVVYKLSPPATKGGAWTEQILHAFSSSGSDGRLPNAALALDSSGNVYGVTQQGGLWNSGAIYQIVPGKAGAFTYSVLYSLGDLTDASTPNGPLLLDSAGALYGVASLGGAFNDGAVYRLSPPAISGGAWTESILFSFGGGSLTSGITPVGNLLFDSAGNLYGVTEAGGNSSGNGVVYQLEPATGSWTESILFQFKGADGTNPLAGLTWNPTDGSLYGTTSLRYDGNVIQLSPPLIAGEYWTETLVHQFSFTDGARPAARILRDASGTLYGTTLNGGTYGCDGYCGVVYKIVP